MTKLLIAFSVVSVLVAGCAARVGYVTPKPEVKTENLSGVAAGIGLVSKGENECYLVLQTKEGKLVNARVSNQICIDSRNYLKTEEAAKRAASKTPVIAPAAGTPAATPPKEQ